MEDFVIDKVSWYKGTELKQDVQLRFRTIATFLQDHGLTKKPLLKNASDIEEDFCIRSADLTEDGLQFMRQVYDKWVRSIDRGKSPQDVKMLERALAQLRK